MLKLHQLFTINLVITFFLLFSILGLISFYSLKEIELNNQTANLTNLIKSIELSIDSNKELNTYAKNLKEQLEVRVTFVALNGKVLGDSDHTVYDMDNHLHRVEMQQALAEEFGVSARHSDTLEIELLYVAKIIEYEHQKIFLRLSKPLKYINNNVYQFWSQLILLLAVIILIVAIINFYANTWVEKQVAFLIKHLQNLSDKKYAFDYEKSWIKEFNIISYEVDTLSQKLQKREKSNREINAKLKLKNRQLQDMISAISHEFKNPIAIILGYARTIVDNKLDETKRDEFLEKIHNNTLKLNNMIDRMSLFTKLENNDIEIKKESNSLETLTKEICENSRIKNKNREIIFEAGENTPLDFDKMLIDLAITNLLENALKYSQDKVIVSVKENEVRIQDFGIGIKKADQKRIKKKYYRVNKNSWDNSMGLGLSLVEFILKLHESALVIESEYEKGSIFSFRLGERRV